MHHWGEEGVDWKGIGDAADWIGKQLVRWGRVSVTQSKEKYGTVRVYLHFGWESPHSITHPGYAYSQYPKWLWRLCYTRPVLWFFERVLNRVVIPYQQWLYRLVYKLALKKWPHLKREILDGADYPEFLEGLEIGEHKHEGE
jgi:hypothetical protein